MMPALPESTPVLTVEWQLGNGHLDPCVDKGPRIEDISSCYLSSRGNDFCCFIVSADLRVETDTFGSRVRIASDKSRNYLCFNRRGRLTVRVSTNLRLALTITLQLQENLSYADNPSHASKKQGRFLDFPERRRQPQKGRQPIIWQNFPKNCMKMNKFGPKGEGARPKFYCIDPHWEIPRSRLQCMRVYWGPR